ncbi:MAG: UV DNA damage endonuclease [Chlamydiales bacterium]|nr:UV DNA damage endonuclease [Chlamydiales bacterium]
MIRFGLCCKFVKAPIHFRTTTVTYLKKHPDRNAYLSEIINHNIQELEHAIVTCKSLNIKSLRINSQFLPACTHPEVGYTLETLPGGDTLVDKLTQCRQLAIKNQVRLTFHPDQFVVLNSPNPSIVEKSLAEIEYHTRLADLLGADVINIHGGGVYGDKATALKRFAESFQHLSPSAQSKLTLENDDKSYTPSDLLPLCADLKIPLVYDVHHHRCHADGCSEEHITEKALSTWDREPLFHLSSPLNGWEGPTPFKHHDYIDPRDFPPFWLEIDPLTVEIEAKAKELAILKLMKDLYD